MSRSKKVLLFLSLFIAVTDGTFVYVNYLSTRDTLYETIALAGLEQKTAFELSNEAVERTMAAMATFVSNDPRVQETFREGVAAVQREGGGPGGVDAASYRNQLNELVKPGWDQVTKDFKVRQLQFHMGPGSTSFLRVHETKRFGDNMDECRYTVVDVNRNLEPVTGFETGRVVSGIRGVVPVFATDPASGEKIHIGALEAGTSFDTILPELSTSLHAGLAILLTKQHVQEHAWPGMMQRAFEDTSQVAGFYVEAYNGPSRDEVLQEGLLQELFANPGTKLVEINGLPNALTGFHLRDFRATKDVSLPPSGLVLIWTSAAEQVAAFHNAVWINVAYAVMGFLVVECLLIFAIRFITRKLNGVINDRTSQLHQAQDKLVDNARLVGMAEVATDVLHNVGNVLNSVNIKTGALSRSIAESRSPGVGRVADLLLAQGDYVGQFIGEDSRGAKIPGYLAGLSVHLQQEQEINLEYVTGLQNHVEHITRIVSGQQEHCLGGELLETTILSEMFENAVEINSSAIANQQVQIVLEANNLPPMEIDRHRCLQVLVNLIRNSVEAHECFQTNMPTIEVSGFVDNDQQLVISVSDNGPGIKPELVDKIFNHGFTTRKKGHGFGLHGAANSAAEMGGTLTVDNRGTIKGASFVLSLPLPIRSAEHVV